MTPAVACYWCAARAKCDEGKKLARGAGFRRCRQAMMALWVAWADFGFAHGGSGKRPVDSCQIWKWIGAVLFIKTLGLSILRINWGSPRRWMPNGRACNDRSHRDARGNNTNFARWDLGLVVLREIIAVPGTGWLTPR